MGEDGLLAKGILDIVESLLTFVRPLEFFGVDSSVDWFRSFREIFDKFPIVSREADEVVGLFRIFGDGDFSNGFDFLG
jgi:hypothetical protein